MWNALERAFERSAIATSAVILAVVASVLIVLDLIFRPAPKDLLVEAHGLLFDLILFGIVILAIDRWRGVRERTARHLEELDDFRSWQEPEAAYRIAGLLRRLQHDGVIVRDLRNVYLANANLSGLSFSGVDFSGANLQGANLAETRLSDANFRGANLRRARLMRATLHQVNFAQADMGGADLRHASMNDNNFSDTNLESADLSGLNLNGACFDRSVFRGANLAGVAMRGRTATIDLSHVNLRDGHFGMVNLAGACLEGLALDRAYLYSFEDITDWTAIASIRDANVHAVREVPDGYWHRVGDTAEDRRHGARARTEGAAENVQQFYDWAIRHGAVDLPWPEWLTYRKTMGSSTSR
jgi:uncharacterized protein YjbI with pentapeptide repeats